MRFVGTLPETNSQFAPENWPKPKRKWEVFHSSPIHFQVHPGATLVSGRVASYTQIALFGQPIFFGKSQKPALCPPNTETCRAHGDSFIW